MDYYEVLEIAEDCSQDDIKRNFQKLILKHHPDKNPQQQDSQMFHKIEEAYRILKDPKTRKEYDSSRFQQSSQSQLIIHDTVSRAEFQLDVENDVHYHVCKCGGWYILDEESDEDEYIICCDECSLVIKVLNKKNDKS